MLDSNRPKLEQEAQGQYIEFASLSDLYAVATGFVRRQYPLIVFAVLLLVALGAVYCFTAPPKYTAQAVFVIDPSNEQAAEPTTATADDAPLDSASVDTQLEILKSDNIAMSVVNDLHLADNPEFTSPYPGFIGSLISFVTRIVDPSALGANGGATDDDTRLRTAVSVFEQNLSVSRVGLTYAIDIDYRSLSPDLAARIANAVGDAYVVDQLDAKFTVTQRASAWLQDRLKELRQQSSDAERAVNDYKQKNNIVDAGGSLLNEQQMAELNSSLIQAQEATAEAKANLDRVEEILNKSDHSDVSDDVGAVSDTLHDDVIIKLRQQYLDLAATYAEWSKKYGPTHLAVVNVRNQMQAIQSSILDELGNIAETYKSDYQVAQAREDSVRQQLASVVAESQTVNGAEVSLQDLQSNADSYSALYNNFLQRYMESVQQQSFPISEARTITPATAPTIKSSPNTKLDLTLATLLGLMFGMGAGVLREVSDGVFRTTAQIKDRFGVDCLAVVPAIKGVGKQVPFKSSSNVVDGERIIVSQGSGLLSTVIASPFSGFTEAIRGLKVAIDRSRLSKTNKIIALTSSLPNEGKSTVATSLAQIIAHSGSRVLLIDADIRNPTLSRRLSPGATTGIIEVISGTAELVDVIWTDPNTGLSFLPTVAAARLAHSSEILGSDATKQLFDSLRKVYDYIIVDLSPLAPIVDARATTHLIDSFLFVVEWGRTNIDFADHTLGMASGVYENLLGVVLNKADMKKVGRYEGYRGDYYRYTDYSKFGYTE